MSYEYPEYFLDVPNLDSVSRSLSIMVTKRMHVGMCKTIWYNVQALSTRVQLTTEVHTLVLLLYLSSPGNDPTILSLRSPVCKIGSFTEMLEGLNEKIFVTSFVQNQVQ